MHNFARQQTEGAKSAQKNYQRRKTEIKGVAKDLRIRYKTIHPLKDADDFGDGEFYGFTAISRQLKIVCVCGDFEVEFEGRKEVIAAVGEATEDWKDAH